MSFHVVGAGLAGLAAALWAADRGAGPVILYDLAPRPGGRCRSWRDAKIGATLDNGPHILLSGNRAAFSYLARIGKDALMAPLAAMPNSHGPDGEERSLAFGALLPHLVRALPNLLFPGEKTVADAFAASPAFDHLWRPLCVSALNAPPNDASLALFRALLAKSLMMGPKASLPCLPKASLEEIFIRPALDALGGAGASFRPNHRLRAIRFKGDAIAALLFNRGEIAIGPDDRVAIALPNLAAARLIPAIPPLPHSPIVAISFSLPERPDRLASGMAGLFGAEAGADWAFWRSGALSVVCSAAFALMDRPFGEIADIVWRDAAAALGLRIARPAFRVVRNRAATILHAPGVESARPAQRRAGNWALAGDWVRTGLPSTMEGAILSGRRAAALLLDA